MHREWRQYDYDLQVSKSYLDHGTGYLSEDIYGIATRTIKKCVLEKARLQKEIDRYEKE